MLDLGRLVLDLGRQMNEDGVHVAERFRYDCATIHAIGGAAEAWAPVVEAECADPPIASSLRGLLIFPGRHDRHGGCVGRFIAQRKLPEVDLEVLEREGFGFLGPNGAGKTRMIRPLLRICPIGCATWPSVRTTGNPW